MKVSFGQAYNIKTPNICHWDNVHSTIENSGEFRALEPCGKDNDVLALPSADYKEYSNLCGILINSGVKSEIATHAVREIYKNNAQQIDLSNPADWKRSV